MSLEHVPRTQLRWRSACETKGGHPLASRIHEVEILLYEGVTHASCLLSTIPAAPLWSTSHPTAEGFPSYMQEQGYGALTRTTSRLSCYSAWTGDGCTGVKRYGTTSVAAPLAAATSARVGRVASWALLLERERHCRYRKNGPYSMSCPVPVVTHFIAQVRCGGWSPATKCPAYSWPCQTTVQTSLLHAALFPTRASLHPNRDGRKLRAHPRRLPGDVL